jgi:hypothetical protein
MKYVEMTVEEAIKCCNKNAKILVAVHDLKEDDVDIVFVQKKREEYDEIFEGIKTACSYCDDWVKQLKLFTEKQDIRHVKPCGLERIILLRE